MTCCLLQIIEPDENLSDKEIFPNSGSHRTQGGIPAIGKIVSLFFIHH